MSSWLPTQTIRPTPPLIMTRLLPGERRVISRLPLLNPKLFIDVGCSIRGEYSDMVAEACPGITIYGYDPQNGTPAIGAVNGELLFHRYPTVPDRSTGAQIYASMVTGPVETFPVPVRRLDTLHPGAKIDFLKVDVEGMEWEVLQGLGDLQPRLIQFEHGWADNFEGHHHYDFQVMLKDRWNYIMRELDFWSYPGDAESCYYNYLAGPYELVQKFFD